VQEIFLNHHSNDHFSRSSLLSFFHDRNELLHSVSESDDNTRHLQRALTLLFEQFGVKESDHFFFVPTSQEGLMQLCLSLYANVVRQTGKNHFLTITHPSKSVQECFQKFEALGCTSKYLRTNQFGQVSKEILEESWKPRHAFLSLPWANHLTGVIHPIADLAQVCHQKEIFFHVDGSLCFGQLFFRLQDFEIDFFTFEGLFPAAAGLFVREGRPLPRFISDSQVNVLGVLSLAFAAEQFSSWTDYYCMETARLRDKLEQGVMEGFPDARVFFKEADRLPNRTVIAFPGVESEALLYLLRRKHIYATRGGDCYPLLADHLIECQVEATLAKSAVSFALSHKTKEQEIDRAIEEIVQIAKKLRTYSIQLCS